MVEGLDQMSDSDLIIRMLYFCEQSKTPSQIMSYCGIDGVRLKKFTDHCMKRQLLKRDDSDVVPVFVLTERGGNVLATAVNIIQELGMDPAEILTSKR